MDKVLRQHCDSIFASALEQVLPDNAVARALDGWSCGGRLILISVGKAAWRMAQAALQALDRPVDAGAVVTKYGHLQGPLPGLSLFEAGHPVPDEKGLAACRHVLELTRGLTKEDTVLFLLSGGGSALFELPLVPLDELKDITGQLLACGADIGQINTIRKRLSSVKGGRFAAWCAPARVEALILSDVLGDRLDTIASGPVSPDTSTAAQAMDIVRRYDLKLSERAMACLLSPTVQELDNVNARLVGSLGQFCKAGVEAATALGYEPLLLTDSLDCQAREAGRFLAAVARSHQGAGRPLAFLAGGETVVKLQGRGLGGRNQEIALGACQGLEGLRAAVASLGSDGTDGPTDAAGGYCDQDSMAAFRRLGIDPIQALEDNDAYHALKAIDGLLITGPTGTNVNDLSLCLVPGR